MSTIPIIDIEKAATSTASPVVADEIRRACTDVGFLQIVGHNVDPTLLNRVYEVADDLVALPTDEKTRMRSPSGHPFRGWTAYSGEFATNIIERLQVCNVEDEAAAAATGIDEQWRDFFQPNIWPTQVPGFKDAVRACFEATRELGATVMSLFASALELDEDYFTPMLSVDTSNFAINVYRGAVTSSASEPTVIIPEHTDSGTLTLLHQRGDYDGLQVRLRTGERVTVPVIDEAFVINIGDLMARWTNDRWVSTPHRVIAPPNPGEGRVSLTTFYLPAIDTVIEPLPSCVSDDEPARYGPVTPYEWEAEFLSRSYRKAG